MKKELKIAVLGDGGWGTTLAILLDKKGYKVTLWGAFPEYIKVLSSKRENKKFLPGIKIPAGILLTSDIKKAAADKDIIILAAPSQHIREVLRRLPPVKGNPIFVSAAKGIENKTLCRMSEVIKEELGRVNLAVLSGPTISYEIAREMPASCVAASDRIDIAKKIQQVFTAGHFRIYTSRDIVGVEVGGSLKNVIAIAAGISDGLGFGANAKAALLSRGLVEIIRLGAAMGAKKDTFYGLSGLGDLVTTCISSHGRNRWFGEQIGEGRSPAEVLKKTEMVIEGVATVKSAYELARKYKVEMPISEQIHRVIYDGKKPLEAVKELMLRPMKSEKVVS